MEQDLGGLENALLKLEATETSESGQYNHQELYKNRGKYGSQEERRKELLDFQKRNRLNRMDNLRGFMDLVCNVEQDKLFKPHSKVKYRPNKYVAGFHKAPNSYKNVLMLSEWLIEKPEDFEENWLITPCPKSIRVLVVAIQGVTKCFNKYGVFRFECETVLPGGSPRTGMKNHSCMLDCFYNKETKTMYVLDLLAWNAQPMTDGETEFRQFWMKSYLEEIDGIKCVSKSNELAFKMLPMVPCTKQSLNMFFSSYPPCSDPEFPALDGLLFYHKKAQYFSGETPLVGWLFPFMVPEVLGPDIQMRPEYFEGTPSDYVNQADYIQKFEAEANIKKRRSRTNNSMDTESVANNIETQEISEGMDSEEVLHTDGIEKMDAENKPLS
ncbi:unnamed protein product [Leptidea sinapis]|uniref:Snurportin-1 n=1 Tax=Leptidea sinapis TaxID=189913 RepID=A0A5E4R288_9NEOP|nr:unnamed protein product [Leptidea sinapis]